MNQIKLEWRVEALETGIAKGTTDLKGIINDICDRLEQLEMRARLNADEEQRLQVIANAAVINSLNARIAKLETALKQAIANLTAIIADGAETNAEVDCILRQRIDRHDDRIKQLETYAVINAETIGHVAELRRVVARQAKHIEKLEAEASPVHPYTPPEFTASRD